MQGALVSVLHQQITQGTAMSADERMQLTIMNQLLQVYYEDLDNGDRSEAYCSLVHCYSLPDDGGLWVEHGYFDDR